MSNSILLAGQYSPTAFLQTMQQDLSGSPILNTEGRAILSTKIEGLKDTAQDFEDVYPVVRSAWYLLARDYVRQLPQAKAAVFPLSRVDEALSLDKFSQGRTVDDQADIEEESLLEVHHPADTLDESEPVQTYLDMTQTYSLAPMDEPDPGDHNMYYYTRPDIAIPLQTEQGELEGRTLMISNFSYRLLSPRTLLTSRSREQSYGRLKPAFVNDMVSRRHLVDFVEAGYWPIAVPLRSGNLQSRFREVHPLILLLTTIDRMQWRERNDDETLTIADCLLKTALSVFPDFVESNVKPISYIIDQAIGLSEWHDVDELIDVIGIFQRLAEGIVMRRDIDLRTVSLLAGGGLAFFTEFESSIQALSERSPSPMIDELLFKLHTLRSEQHYEGNA